MAQAGRYTGREISALRDRNTSHQLRITVEFDCSEPEHRWLRSNYRAMYLSFTVQVP